MRSVPNDMTDALNHCVLSAFTILDLALLFLLFLSNHTIFNFSKSLFFDTSILVPFVTLDQGLNPWRWKQILFMVPTDIAAFRNISLCKNQFGPLSNLHSSHSRRGSSIYHCVNPTQHPSPALTKSNKNRLHKNTKQSPHHTVIGTLSHDYLDRSHTGLIYSCHFNFSSAILAIMLMNIQKLPKKRLSSYLLYFWTH